MKKTLLLTSLLALSSIISCSSSDKGSGNSGGGNAQQKVVLPTSKQLVKARQSSSTTVDSQGYDFNIKLVADGSFAGLSKTLTGNYNCQFRQKLSDNTLSFRRTTSGELFFDSTKYIICKGDSKVALKYNDEGEFKKSKVSQNDIDVDLLNLPFEKFMDSLQESDISNIGNNGESGYKFKSRVKLSTDNKYLKPVFSLLGSMGPKLKIKNVEFDNLANGIDLNFNMNSDFTSLEGFSFSFNLKFPFAVKGKSGSAGFSLTYSQNLASSEIALPDDSNIKVKDTEITPVINKINSSIDEYKASNAYSLDIEAKNELDPAWNKSAIKDTYTARIYKNSDAFNHSFKYKAHTEEDGKESFKYVIGNLQDNSVHKVKVKTTVNEDLGTVTNTANTQYEYLTNPFKLSHSNVDCIKEETKGTKTTYTLFLNNAETYNIQNKILAYVNSNDEQGVIKAENYFDSTDNTIRKSKFTVIYEDNDLKEIVCKTKLSYSPTDGDYIGYNVTLDNFFSASFNNKLSDANKYEKAKNPTGTLTSPTGGLKYLL